MCIVAEDVEAAGGKSMAATGIPRGIAAWVTASTTACSASSEGQIKRAGGLNEGAR